MQELEVNWVHSHSKQLSPIRLCPPPYEGRLFKERIRSPRSKGKLLSKEKIVSTKNRPILEEVLCLKIYSLIGNIKMIW